MLCNKNVEICFFKIAAGGHLGFTKPDLEKKCDIDLK